MATAPSQAQPVEPAVTDPPPPFWIKRVRLRNYKSIGFCDVSLEPMTVLVGRNGAGKSNFLDALAFVGELSHRDIRDVINDHGGDGLLNQAIECESCEIKVTVSFRGGEMLGTPEVKADRSEFEYTFRYFPKRAKWSDRIEEMIVCDSTGGVELFDGETRYVGDWQWPDDRLPPGPSVGYSLLTTQGPYLDFLRKGLRGLRRYNIQPDALRPRTRRGPATFLKREGGNAATVYRYLAESGSWRFERLQRYLEAVVPQLRGVVPRGTEDEDGLDFLWWTGEVTAWPEMPRAGDPRIKTFSAARMSDGTLRAFGVLLAALQTAELEGDPSVILLEEPEAGLHPTAARALVAALDEATLRVQVVMTTHSPEVLATPEITPAKVRVVDARGGQTIVGPVDEASLEIVARKLSTLGDLERENQLEPDQDDQERQRLLAGNGARPHG
jgi:predicted ATPase